jgi:hypothetical protein
LGILIDCEAYATVAATDNNAGAVVVGRVQGDSTSTFSGYLLELSPIGRFVLTRYNNGTPTQIATTSASLTTTNGDQFAIRCLGSRIEAWGKLAADGGVWKIYTTAVDFTYFSGFIGTGMHLVSTVGSYALAVDNFGGGPINYEIYTPGVFVPESQPLLPLIAEWMGQKFLTNTQIINEAFIPAGGPVDYVESATISSVTSVQSSENTDWLDTSGSINGVSSITTTETSQFVEVATISSVTALTSVEVFAPFIQKAAVQPLLMHLRDVAGMRLIMPVPVPDFIVIVGVNYTDSATVSGVTSVQSSENTDFLDTSGSINGTSSVTSTETAQYVEASTVSSTTSLTSVETTDYVETATIATVTTISVQVETYPTPPAFITPLLVTLGRGDRLHNLILNPDYVITGVVYTDSAVVASVTSVQSSENTDWLDTSGSINGTSSITSTETSQYVESATIACTTSITSVETTDYVETSTISSITTLTVQVETYPTPPASVTPLLIKIAGKGVRLHNLILNPADSVRVNYTDSSTVAGITSIQSSENTDFLDTSGTVQGTSSITSTETAQFVESATVAGVTSISTTDTAQYVDSATGATITVVTSADVAAYVDSATVSSVTSITSVDTADYVETATIAGVTTVTTADQYIPFTTAPLTITPQPLLIALARHGLLHNNRLNPADSVRVNYVDSATITSVTATTSTETGDWVDTAGTISGTSTVTSTETAQYVDPATVASTTSLSTTETSTYVDQNIGATVTVVISTETTDYVETALVTSITSLQSNEQYAPLGIITQFAPIPLLIKFGHGTKLHNNRLTFADSVRVNYVESATISTSTSPTSTETTDFVDGVPAACKTTITFTEIPSGTDSLTVNGTTTLTSTETAQYVESGLLRTVTSVFSFEDYTPIITAYSDLYIIGAQSRWAITEAMPRWSISSTRQRWQLMAHSPRWAVQGVKRGWSH